MTLSGVAEAPAGMYTKLYQTASSHTCRKEETRLGYTVGYGAKPVTTTVLVAVEEHAAESAWFAVRVTEKGNTAGTLMLIRVHVTLTSKKL